MGNFLDRNSVVWYVKKQRTAGSFYASFDKAGSEVCFVFEGKGYGEGRYLH